MPTISSFRDLVVWQKAMDLTVRTWRTAQRLPRLDQPVLGYQLRKSALSVPSNIAEGFSRRSSRAYVQHLWTAHASGCELETQLEVGKRVEAVSPEEADLLISDMQEVGRMLNGLVRSLERVNG